MEKKFAYTCEFNENFSKKNGERTMLSHKLRKVCRKYVSRNYYQKCARETFPFINTIRSYKVKEYLINDIISGLTVGVMQIPQGNITILTCPTEICQRTEEIREVLIRLRCAISAKNT